MTLCSRVTGVSKHKTNCRRKVITNHEQGDKEVSGDCSDDIIATEWCN